MFSLDEGFAACGELPRHATFRTIGPWLTSFILGSAVALEERARRWGGRVALHEVERWSQRDHVGGIVTGTRRALHEVEPREQIGAKTGELYEYQYHQAAAQVFSLLDDENAICIYCEWHDDYVLETNASSSYAFHQVKTRKKSKGPWKLSDFFGLGPNRKGKATPPARQDSIFAHLWDHTTKFGGRCGRFVFVTDAGISDDLRALLQEVKASSDPTKLSPAVARTFERVRNAALQTFATMTEGALFSFLQRTWVQDGLGAVHDLDGCRVLIANRILEASEVDLAITEARKIGAHLVSAVRARSHRVLSPLPSSIEDLRERKALVIDNVLALLSLSTEGYRELKKGGRESVRALSRLHRLCKRNGVPESLIPDLCRYKTAWDAWWLDQRHRVDELDYLTLKGECAMLLRSHSDGHLPIEQLIQQARLLAGKFQGKLASSEPLAAELVVGLIVGLAVEAEV